MVDKTREEIIKDIEEQDWDVGGYKAGQEVVCEYTYEHILEEEQYCARCWFLFCSYYQLSIFIVAIVATVYELNFLLGNWLIFGFIIATQAVEPAILLFVWFISKCICICNGKAGEMHAAAILGLLFRFLTGVSFYCSAGFGYFLIVKVLRPDYPPLVLAFVALEVISSTYMLLSTLNTVVKLFLYVCHKLKAKIERRPEVIFFSHDKPINYYVHQDVEMALQNLDKSPTKSNKPVK
eukprot:GHVR01114040.1.p1 GENE.GHVR01114040.1~~GHVR01114040.1.p1  ORF type:complete len:237 (+),score=24.09 GHVR01114040.1:66-776(+)